MENQVTYPKFKWYMLFMITIAILAQGMMLIAPTPLVGVISEAMGIDLGVITAALMMPFTLMVAIGGILSGPLMDKIGLYKTYLMGTALAAIAGLATPALGDSLGALVVLRALQGLGCGPLIASGPKLAAEWFPRAQRGLVQGVTGAALSLGITIGLVAGPQIATGSGNWTTSLLVFGVVMAISFVLIALSKLGPSAPVVERLEEVASKGEVRKIMAMPVFWLTLVCVFSLSWVMQGYNDLTPGHLAVPEPAGLNLGAEVAGQIMGIYTIAFMVGSLVSGFVAEKIFRAKYKTAIFTAFILTAIFCFSVTIPAVNGNQGTLMACLVLAGFFMGMPMPIAMTSISNFYPEHLTGAIGGMTMGLGIFGGTIGVAAGSAALHATGMYYVSIIIVCVVALIGAAASFGIKRPAIYDK